ncbi:hypothetical protein HYY72_04590 [Candidatus Woesearchaeota archaeon]|nr:hypothetical protein [Candidatus Woesearchaeota archaeon]
MAITDSVEMMKGIRLHVNSLTNAIKALQGNDRNEAINSLEKAKLSLQAIIETLKTIEEKAA